MINVLLFLAKIQEIISEAPSYKKGGFGLGGICDCIGLIIGALRRLNAGWGKTHGSNYALRYEMRNTFAIKKIADLYPGLAVYKYREAGAAANKLPATYANHPDQCDYYHVGVVISVNPLKIAHCTSWSGGSGIKIDTTLGQWKIAGELKRVDYGAGSAAVQVTLPVTNNTPDSVSTTTFRTLRYTPGQAYMRGEDVGAVQSVLAGKGYTVGTIDGVYGAKTKAAVRAFQIDAFPGQPKEWDGVVGAKTWSKLGVTT